MNSFTNFFSLIKLPTLVGLIPSLLITLAFWRNRGVNLTYTRVSSLVIITLLEEIIFRYLIAKKYNFKLRWMFVSFIAHLMIFALINQFIKKDFVSFDLLILNSLFAILPSLQYHFSKNPSNSILTNLVIKYFLYDANNSIRNVWI